MAEETKPQEKEAKKSTLGDRMSDVGGMRVFRDGKWIPLSDLTKKKPEQKEEKKPVVASSYLESILSSGGSAAPAEVLDMDKIKRDEKTVLSDDDSVVATSGSKPAPKKDQIEGSDKNAEGSASAGRKITFSKAVEASLKEKVESHNKGVSADGKKVTLSMLKAVYRRGAGAFSTSHRPDQNRNSWAMGRVNAFLHLVKSGSPSNAKYTTDNDLLPKSHAKSTRASIVASAFEDDNYESELSVVLLPESEYTSKEQALLALAEYSGLGYESIPAMNAAWIRGEKVGQNGFDRASELAIGLYESPDSDLLPKEF